MAKNTTTSKNVSTSNTRNESQETSKNWNGQTGSNTTSKNAKNEGNSTSKATNCHNSYEE